MIRRRLLVAAAASAAAVGGQARAARAPALPLVIRLLVGAPAGVGTDLEARAFAPFLERHVPHAEVQIVNLPGQGGLVAYQALAAAGPDPLTLGWVASPSLAARMVDRGDTSLLGRLTLLGATQEEPLALVVAESSPIDSIRAVFRSTASDAQAMAFGVPPAGSIPHLGALHLQALAGMALNIVPFPSVAAVRQAVMDGNVAAALLELGDVIAALRDGRLTALGLADSRRAEFLPDVPTLMDDGIPLHATTLRGLAAPAGLRDGFANLLIAGLQAVVADPEYKSQGDNSGFSLIWVDGPNWLARLGTEQADLAQLWQTAPWLPGKNG